MYGHSFIAGTPINNAMVPMSTAELMRLAPSAFAQDAHESRSNRYTFLPTSDVIAGLAKEGFLPFNATQSRSRIAGKSAFTKHMIRFRSVSQASMVRVGDVFPEVVLVNSHDGTSSYKLMAGLFRLACSNGLVVASSTVSDVTVHHKGNIVDGVIEGTFNIARQLPQATDRVQAWQQLALTAGEQTAFAKAAHVYRFGEAETDEETGRTIEATPILPQALLSVRRREDAGSDLWSTLNRVQENAVKGGMRARGPRDAHGNRGRMVTARQVTGIDQDVKLNKALWIIAEHFQAAKTGAASA